MRSTGFSSCRYSALIWGSLFCLSLITGGALSAEDPQASETVPVSKETKKKSDTAPKADAAKKESKNNNALSPKREKAALDFARSHHPELAELIERLKKHRPREYRRAIRDLDTTLSRLERFKNRDSDRYRLTLERWEVDSRIRLLAARVSIKGSDEDQAELKSLLKQRVDLQLELLQTEKKSAEKRLQKLEKSISEMEQNRDRLVDAELKRINRSVKKPKSKTTNKK
ncbi:hypothetical protein Pan153_08220 [Gimesia panareensis]|uniref:Chromosome partition protein Smc n=1 Tax=Gimesia panareensis TaxID=2527978 RepID=A0A518FIM3_9PLAN|nr:hypothetical protein [Gimesia panareensis]QDV16201.1 hypothetical protein Pan153_08220 [Gimesia panareensis]